MQSGYGADAGFVYWSTIQQGEPYSSNPGQPQDFLIYTDPPAKREKQTIVITPNLLGEINGLIGSGLSTLDAAAARLLKILPHEIGHAAAPISHLGPDTYSNDRAIQRLKL